MEKKFIFFVNEMCLNLKKIMHFYIEHFFSALYVNLSQLYSTKKFKQ